MLNSSESTKKFMALMALCLGYFMVIIDVMIINVALPTLAHDLGGDLTQLQWVVDGYTLTFACLLLSAGSFADRLGAKFAFLSGLILFILTSIGCGLAKNFIMLTFFRLLQGTAGALLVPTALALIHACYHLQEERAKAIGIWAGLGGLAAAAAPVIGAVLTTALGWRAIFFVNLPIGILAIILTQVYVPNPKPIKTGQFDLWGQITGIICLAALALGLIEAGRLGWQSPLIGISLMIFILSFLVFLKFEQRSPHPMLPLSFFRIASFSAVMGIGLVLNICIYGLLFILPLYFQQVRGYTVLMTGFAILPMLALGAIASYYGGNIVSIKGVRFPMVIGLAVGGLACFSLLMAKSHGPHYGLFILPLAGLGFCANFTMPAATIAVMNAVPEGRAGIASAAFNVSRQIGSLVGVAIFGSILSSHQFMQGMHLNLILAGIGCLLGLGLCLGFIKRG